jgi:esterase/lipase superfamily enzyme
MELGPNNEYSLASGRPLYRVWFGTNRSLVDPTRPDQGFSNERSQSLIYGTCIVYVPQSHVFGSDGSSWIWRTLRRTDDRLKLESIQTLDEGNFMSFVRSQLGRRPPTKRQILVYIHGFRTTFAQAAIRAAQIGYDLKVEGITAFFSWPSRGAIERYPADEATIEASEPFFEQFLTNLIATSGAEDVSVIAHSMGNRGLLRIGHSLARLAQTHKFRLGQVFLAAPDVDADTFKRLAATYTHFSKRTTLYVSSKDKALQLSEIVHGAARAGYFPPITIMSGIDTIKVTNVDLSVLGHSYFAEAGAVLYDMHSLLTNNTPPGERLRLEPRRTLLLQRYWELAR